MRLLIAEDDRTTRALLEGLTRRWGYEPVPATNGDEAWSRLQEPDGPRLALLDWLMPGLDGVEICRRLAAREPPRLVYVVLLTSLTGEQSLDEAFDSGAHDFLSKPVRPGELERRLAAGRRIIRYDEELARQRQERARLELELRHTQRLEAVGRLAAGMAHEIEAPIQQVGDSLYFLSESWEDLRSLISGYREVVFAARDHVEPTLLAAVRESEEIVDLTFLASAVPSAFERTRSGVDQVAERVRALKQFARPVAEPQPIDLNRAVRNALELASHAYREWADSSFDEGELPLVPCDPSDLGQVLLHLVVNASQAIQDVVRTTGERGRIHATTHLEDGYAVIALSDTGVGIPDEVADRVFDPFFTTREVGRGTGQGLAIAHHVIVGRHGGQIAFESHPGQGTTFTVRLPVDPQS